jgi:hypothetical protein
MTTESKILIILSLFVFNFIGIFSGSNFFQESTVNTEVESLFAFVMAAVLTFAELFFWQLSEQEKARTLNNS